MQETPARRKRQERGCAAEHTPPTPHPAGRAGLEPRPRGRPERPEHAAGMPQSASACLHPWAAAQRCPHPSFLPRPFSQGMRWLDTSGMRGKVGMGLGMMHRAGFPKSSLQTPRGGTPRAGTRSGSWSCVPCWEHRRRRMPRPGWHQGPVQRWHWLAEGP